MSRTIVAAALIAVFALAACATPVQPSGTPAVPNPTPAPTTAPSPDPTVAPATPEPTEQPTTPQPTDLPADPTPTPRAISAEERYLLDGVRRGATDCAPVVGRDKLPDRAIAGIECASTDDKVARIGFYLFADDEAMLKAYVARMRAEGVALDSGSCRDGENEGPYTAGDGMVPFRNGCFINADGYANFRATLPGAHVYIGILGRSSDMAALEDFAWVGNQDAPGSPTLWRERS